MRHSPTKPTNPPNAIIQLPVREDIILFFLKKVTQSPVTIERVHLRLSA